MYDLELYVKNKWLYTCSWLNMTLWEQIVHVSSYTIGVRRAVMILFTHHPCKPAGVATLMLLLIASI